MKGLKVVDSQESVITLLHDTRLCACLTRLSVSDGSAIVWLHGSAFALITSLHLFQPLQLCEDLPCAELPFCTLMDCNLSYTTKCYVAPPCTVDLDKQMPL